MTKVPVGDFFGLNLPLWPRGGLALEKRGVHHSWWIPAYHSYTKGHLRRCPNSRQYRASTLTPLELGIPTPPWIQQDKPAEYWEIETEAHLLQSQPDQIGLLAEKSIGFN